MNLVIDWGLAFWMITALGAFGAVFLGILLFMARRQNSGWKRR